MKRKHVGEAQGLPHMMLEINASRSVGSTGPATTTSAAERSRSTGSSRKLRGLEIMTLASALSGLPTRATPGACLVGSAGGKPGPVGQPVRTGSLPPPHRIETPAAVRSALLYLA